jgi:TRAP-type C4-dicarboxylate transport system substrate-binding protein
MAGAGAAIDHPRAARPRPGCPTTEIPRMKPRSILPAPLLALALLATATTVQAQSKPVELRYTSGAPPKGNPWVTQIERFVAAVDEESKGEVKVQPFFASQLGSEQDTVQQLARGRIDFGGFSTGSVALVVPEMALLSVPGYFDSLQQQDCVLDQHLIPLVTELFDKKGVKFLGWGEIGAIDLFGTKPFATPKDLNGVKAAAYASKSQMVTYASLGATAVPLGLPEWIPAFQTGMVQVVQTPITFALPSGLTKVAPVATRWGMVDTPAFNLMNKGSFDRLSKPHQEAVTRAYARTPSTQLRTEVRGFESTLFGMFEKAGGQIVTLNAEQRAAWLKALGPNQQRIADEIGGSAKQMLAAMEAGRKACPK